MDKTPGAPYHRLKYRFAVASLTRTVANVVERAPVAHQFDRVHVIS